VHSAVVHLQAIDWHGSTVHFVSAAGTGEAEVAVSKDPGPIVPEMKELAWGAGSFVVFALLMRFVLFPKVKKGMDARYEGIRSSHETADAERSSARSEVADYARQTLEAERQATLAEVNAGIAERRTAAVAQADAVRTAARDQIHAAVSDVAGRAGELATGRRPAADIVDRAVSEVMAR